MNEKLSKICRALKEGKAAPMETITVNGRTVFMLVRKDGMTQELQIGSPPPHYNKLRPYVVRNFSMYEVTPPKDELLLDLLRVVLRDVGLEKLGVE